MYNHPIHEQLQKEYLSSMVPWGRCFQAENLTYEDFGGEDLDGCNENLVLTRPDVLGKIHREYLAARR